MNQFQKTVPYDHLFYLRQDDYLFTPHPPPSWPKKAVSSPARPTDGAWRRELGGVGVWKEEEPLIKTTTGNRSVDAIPSRVVELCKPPRWSAWS